MADSDTDFQYVDPIRQKEGTHDGRSGPIEIEDAVFIGMNAIILKGSHIGKGTVIGVGSVVSGEIPPNVIVTGNPVQIIRTI